MNTKLFIGYEQADFFDNFNVIYSIGDIRNFTIGGNNKSYTLNLPLTTKNKSLIHFSNDPSVKTEITEMGLLMYGDMVVLRGKVNILSITDSISLMISADDWINKLGAVGTRSLEKDSMRDLDLSAYDYTISYANIEASWVTANSFYIYPMIYYGEQMNNGAFTPSFNNYDFLPAFRLLELMTEILKPYTIVSTFLNSTYFKSKYMLATELRYTENFISGKNLLVYQNWTDNNYQRVTIPAGSGNNGSYDQSPLKMTTESDDQANAWTVNQYVVPEDGIYRFKGRITGYCVIQDAAVTITNSAIDVLIKINGVTRSTDSQNWGDGSLDGYQSNFDLGYLTLAKGDIITIHVNTTAQGTNSNYADAKYFDHGTMLGGAAITYLELDWSIYNLMPGLNDTVYVSKWLPDIKQIDFLKGIKEAFNLVFFVDNYNRNIYIEPKDQFNSNTVMDLTPYMSYENDPRIDLISQNYYKKTILQWKDSSGDKAMEGFILSNPVPFTKEINIASSYAQPGKEDIYNSVFGCAPSLRALGYYLPDWDLPSLWGSQIDSILKRPLYRNYNLPNVLLDWKGLTANPSGTWLFDGVYRTTYPKVVQLNYNDLVNSYFIKTLHRIDGGKIATIETYLPMTLLSQFSRVVNVATDEGFRPIYMFTWEGNDYYGIINKVTTNGDKSEIELILL